MQTKITSFSDNVMLKVVTIVVTLWSNFAKLS